jgi:DNA-binding GntR family transcriptional regulator
MTMTSVGARHRTLRDETIDELRRLILDGILRPGEHLSEHSVSERLGVSRLPVREAFRRLEAEGLLEPLPRRGVRVVELNGDELTVVREMRVALELIAVRAAIARDAEATMASLRQILVDGQQAVDSGDDERLLRLNDEFHEIIGAGGGSRFLAESLRAVRNQAHHLVGGISTAIIPSWDEHAAIIQATLDHDAEMATMLMRRHLARRHANQGGPVPTTA